jgi:transposase
MTPASTLVGEDLWQAIRPLLPPEPPKPKGGRPRVPDRAALAGIIYVLKSGILWGMLPKAMGCGSGVTCWRRLRDWQKAGVWRLLLKTLRDRLGRGGCIDWSRASVDTATIPTKRGRGYRPKPCRPGQGRHQAPSAGRSARYPARSHYIRCQCPRLQVVRGTRRLGGTRERSSRQASQTSRQAPCG